MSISVDFAMSAIRSVKGKRAELLRRFGFACLDKFRPRGNIALKNMSLVFPDMTDADKEELLRGHYKNLCLMMTEICGWQSDFSLINRGVEAEGREYIDSALAEGNGVIILNAHIGNWEHGAAWIGRNYGATGIVQYGDSKFERELTNRLREGTGLRILEKNESMLKAVSVLKKGGMLGIISDQYSEEGIKVPFFGHPTYTATGAAVFSYLTGAKIIPGFSRRLAPFKFKLKFFPPIEWRKLKTKEKTIYEITKKSNEAIEQMIRLAPEQWFWLHRRFKDVVDY